MGTPRERRREGASRKHLVDSTWTVCREYDWEGVRTQGVGTQGIKMQKVKTRRARTRGAKKQGAGNTVGGSELLASASRCSVITLEKIEAHILERRVRKDEKRKLHNMDDGRKTVRARMGERKRAETGGRSSGKSVPKICWKALCMFRQETI